MTLGSIEYIEEVDDETEDYYSNDDIFDFNSWGADLSFRELIQQYKDEELIKPEIQRNYVWDKVEASRFIESILLGLPIPSIFLAKQDDERLLIIDGYQRIKSVYDYVNGVFSGDNKTFKLTNSKKINQRWRGKAFLELSDIEQRRINKATIHSIIFAEKRPQVRNTGMYQVFERINTSGRTLFPQEIRNCVYQGKLNKLVIELNRLPDWRTLLGSPIEDPRMRDIELIIRFFSILKFHESPPEQQTISLKKYLNEFMGDKSNNEDARIEELGGIFMRYIPAALSLFGNLAFHNLSGSTAKTVRTKFNPTIFDSIMVAMVKNYTGRETPEQMIQRRNLLLKDEQYGHIIRFKTTDSENITNRIGLAAKYLFEA